MEKLWDSMEHMSLEELDKFIKKMTRPKDILEAYKLKKEWAKIHAPPKKQQLVFSSVDSRVIAEEKKKDQELDLLVASDPLVPVSNWYNDEIKQVRLSELPDLIEVHPFYEGEDKEFLLKCRAK